jgi:uncharacterized protein (TIGR02145 family)
MKSVVSLLSVLFLMCQSCADSNSSNQANDKPTYKQGPNLMDIEGNIYKSIINCSQTFMQSNLNVAHYRNGDIIPNVTNQNQWDKLKTGAWRYYNNDPLNGAIYGKLYNRYAVIDPRGLAPQGWHIPTLSEWEILINCLGGELVAGSKMKESGSTHWQYDSGVSNSSGFNGLPGGMRITLEPDVNINKAGYWWSSTDFNMLQLDLSNRATLSLNASESGQSVRCIKNY